MQRGAFLIVAAVNSVSYHFNCLQFSKLQSKRLDPLFYVLYSAIKDLINLQQKLLLSYDHSSRFVSIASQRWKRLPLLVIQSLINFLNLSMADTKFELATTTSLNLLQVSYSFKLSLAFSVAWTSFAFRIALS